MLEVVNPYDLTFIGEAPVSDWEKVDEYLKVAHKLHQNRSGRLPAYRRIEILKRAAVIMQERFDILALQIASEGGKPLVDARIEVERAIDGVGLCITELPHLTGGEIPMGLTKAGADRLAFSTREPIGPIVAVSAFNHPLNLIVHQVAPAVAVGCPVIVKPADDTPLSCIAFVKILYEAGLPEEWCRFVCCDIPTAERMVTDGRVAFFSFIGSAKVGWRLRSQLPPGTRCALEHGGVAPVIVGEDANIDQMIPNLVKGGFYHSGQVCVSVQRVFAPSGQAREVAKQLAAASENLSVGNAIKEETDCGPLIRPAEVDRVAGWVDEANTSGGEIFSGGERLGQTTYAPTVVFNPSEDAAISRKEIFGPAICVYDYETFDEAISRANSLPFAFQAAVFSKSLSKSMHAVRNLDAAAVMVNDHTAFRVDWMPFAGRKQSGYGVGGIGHTMREMTQEKMAVIKL